MIRLSNGHEFTFQCASGALGFDGLGYWWEHPLRWLGIIDPTQFTVVSKSVTVDPKKGNLAWWHPWTCVRLLPRGVVNNVGQSNPGVEYWAEKHYPRAKNLGYKIAASVDASTWEDGFTLGIFLCDLDLAFIELNVSCPNTVQKACIVKIARGIKEAAPKHPIILKISYNQAFDLDLMNSINEEPSIEGIHAINSVPWKQVFPHKTCPIQKGGVSGECIHDMARQAVRSVFNLTQKPVIAGGGIYTRENIKNFKKDGASAFSLGTVFLKYPWRAREIISDRKQEKVR